MTPPCVQAQTIDPHSDWTWNVLKLSGNLPAGSVNESYNSVLAVAGGKSPYDFSLRDGVLPPGITLNPATGTLSGKPSTTGTFSFYVRVTDSRGETGRHAFGIVVGSGSETVDVHVSPTSTSLSSNQNQQFTATVSGTSNTGVTWSATLGSVNSGGLYSAPTVTAKTNVVVAATSVVDSSKFASAAITIDPANSQALQITTGNLPQGQQGDVYSEVFIATGGTAPYSWNISAGTPPAGIAMNTNGQFTGVPTAAGTSSFTVTVTDATNKTASGNFSVTVVAGGNFDGPAELPRVTVSSAMTNTPAPGPTISVKSGGDLQSALNNAQCGNTIALQAGATFSGVFKFPAQNCDSGHWIIVRTSAPDTSLPAEGQRLTPCYAGVASLPGRPQYACNNPQNVLAKLVVSGPGDGPVIFESGANHYRLVGLEITRPTGVKASPTLMSVEQQGNAEYIVLDRSWLHGTTQDETKTGFNLAGSNYVAVVDSYFTDFHCTAMTGQCTDAHAVSGGTGEHQDGPYGIQDNFLEASGEGILFGGAAATTTPADITISFNHFFKPWQWMPGSEPFQGGDSGNPFIVKNHFEFKNASRVLAEANLLENVWGGFSQRGFGILLNPSNQTTQTQPVRDVCPICVVTDVTIRYTHIIHAGGGMALSTDISGHGLADHGAAAKAGARWSIHDVVLDDISEKKYKGTGRLFGMSNTWPTNPLNNVTINHITGFPDATGGFMFVGNNSANQMYGFVFTNNIVITGLHPMWDALRGDSCAASDVPVTLLNKCFLTYSFNHNALLGASPHFGPSMWPTSNLFGPSPSNAVFIEFDNGNSGNYELQPNSPYKNAGSDGKDLGADIVGLNAALAGVE
ncbi:MAG TPA: Ig domain-containing protein [Terriglobales bacterium]